MKKPISALAGVALALGLAVAAPVAAMAAGYAPIPEPGTSTTPVAAPGAPVTLSTVGWDPLETVKVISEDDAVTLAATTLASGLSPSSAGALAIGVKSTVTGSHKVTFIGSTTGSVSFTLTIDPSLAYTGVADPTPYIWLASGLVLAGAAAAFTAVAVRRQRAKVSH